MTYAAPQMTYAAPQMTYAAAAPQVTYAAAAPAVLETSTLAAPTTVLGGSVAQVLGDLHSGRTNHRLGRLRR